jgi:Lon protease-like protein
MLADALHSNRMFAVALRKPGRSREIPAPVAGLGLIRVSVGHRDGTSHLVLQGVARVSLEQTVRYRPYRVSRIRSLPTPPCDSVAADALLAKVRELLGERVKLGLPFSFSAPGGPASGEILQYLDSITDVEALADLVSCAVLAGAEERQQMLETVDVETRLRRLIRFLLAEIRRHRKSEPHE